MIRAVTREPPAVETGLILVTLLLLGVLLLLPLIVVFTEAFARGFGPVLRTLSDPDALNSIWLTLIVAGISVPLNAVCGIAAAWCIGRFDFPGRGTLTALIDLPFSVSPVISGLVWVLLFGAHGWFGPLLAAADIRVMFALPALVLATMFVTFPFVARELIPLMQEQGALEEEAAVTLGASGWRVFVSVTLPNIRWALLYGVLLCNARAMGEFGAVSVVSGRIRGQTTTLPLYVEALYNDFDTVGAFTVAALLSLLALMTLVVKAALESRIGRRPGASL